MPDQDSSASIDNGGVVLRIADEFTASLAEVSSEQVLGRIYEQVGLLTKFPDCGSPNVRPVLSQRYGTGLRQLVVSPHVIVYRHEGAFVDVLALVYGPSVK